MTNIDIFRAVRAGDLSVVDSFLTKLPTLVEIVDEDGKTPLHVAAFFGRYEIAKLLLDHGANANIRSFDTPFHKASCRGNIDVVDLLLEHGADRLIADNDGNLPIDRALDNQFYLTVNILVATEPHIFSVIINGTPSEMSMVIKNGADVNTPRKNGARPLHWSSWTGRPMITSLLLANGAVVAHCDHFGRNALHRARDKETARMLIANGLDVNVRDSHMWTPLHWAANQRRFDVAQVLLLQGADVNAQSITGETPLHKAALVGDIRMVKLLLSHMADTSIHTDDGKTAFDMALFLGPKAIVDMLSQHDASSGNMGN